MGTIFTVLGTTRLGIEPTTYRLQGVHPANRPLMLEVACSTGDLALC